MSQSYVTTTEVKLSTTTTTITTTKPLTTKQEHATIILDLRTTTQEPQTLITKMPEFVALTPSQNLGQELPTPPPYNHINQNVPTSLF